MIKLKLKNVSRDINGNLCAEAVTSIEGKEIAKAGQCQWEGQIVIEKGMEKYFIFKEPKEKPYDKA